MSDRKPENWELILFGDRETNKPLSAYKVGVMGCTAIEGKFHGIDEGGLEAYSYILKFEDGLETEIVDTMLVE